MAKVEPWFTPRDEDGDEHLINQLGRASGGPPKGGGCVVLVLAGAAAATVAFLAPVVVR